MASISAFGSNKKDAVGVPYFAISIGNTKLTPVPPKYINNITVDRLKSKDFACTFTINLTMPVDTFQLGDDNLSAVLSALIALNLSDIAKGDESNNKITITYGWKDGAQITISDAIVDVFDMVMGDSNSYVNYKITGVSNASPVLKGYEKMNYNFFDFMGDTELSNISTAIKSAESEKAATSSTIKKITKFEYSYETFRYHQLSDIKNVTNLSGQQVSLPSSANDIYGTSDCPTYMDDSHEITKLTVIVTPPVDVTLNFDDLTDVRDLAKGNTDEWGNPKSWKDYIGFPNSYYFETTNNDGTFPPTPVFGRAVLDWQEFDDKLVGYAYKLDNWKYSGHRANTQLPLRCSFNEIWGHYHRNVGPNITPIVAEVSNPAYISIEGELNSLLDSYQTKLSSLLQGTYQLSNLVEKIAKQIFSDNGFDVEVEHSDPVYENQQVVVSILKNINNLSSITLYELLKKLVSFCYVSKDAEKNTDSGSGDPTGNSDSQQSESSETSTPSFSESESSQSELYNSKSDFSKPYQMHIDYLRDKVYIGSSSYDESKLVLSLNNSSYSSNVISFNSTFNGLLGITTISNALKSTDASVDVTNGLAIASPIDLGGLTSNTQSNMNAIINAYKGEIAQTLDKAITNAEVTVWGNSDVINCCSIGSSRVTLLPSINGGKTMWCGDYVVMNKITDTVDKDGFRISLGLKLEKSAFSNDFIEAIDDKAPGQQIWYR